ncbi:MAG: anti-sigma F factor antagonist [Firmicutes bacterium]|jgi:stage II sporulation protein AA (anti-sigma F factor antagonist)|nr:anti-sigma F factor antagonist [Bacillota bacterium]
MPKACFLKEDALQERTFRLDATSSANASGGDKLKVQTRKVGASLVVRLSGELDLATAEIFRRTVDAQLAKDGCSNLILVLKNVTFIDSSGIGAILGRYRLIRERQGRVIATGLRPAVRRVLEMSGVLRVVETAETEQQALESL